MGYRHKIQTKDRICLPGLRTKHFIAYSYVILLSLGAVMMKRLNYANDHGLVN